MVLLPELPLPPCEPIVPSVTPTAIVETRTIKTITINVMTAPRGLQRTGLDSVAALDGRVSSTGSELRLTQGAKQLVVENTVLDE